MAHYAFLNSENIVIEVIVGQDEGDTDWEQHYSEFRGKVCKRTSYNTVLGGHRLNGTPFRKNYAGIGYTYDADRDAFISPKPYASWVLDENTCSWVAPIAYPDDNSLHIWNETTVSWDKQE
jgi:hypothetical protein